MPHNPLHDSNEQSLLARIKELEDELAAARWPETELRRGAVSNDANLDDAGPRLAEGQGSESEEKFRGIFENAPVGIYQTSVEGRIISVNPTLARLFGYESPAQMQDAARPSASFFVDPRVRPQMIAIAMESQNFVRQEVEFRRRDGSKFIATLWMRVVRDHLGEVRFLEGFLKDITARKVAEEELRKLSEVVQQSPVSIAITDTDGVVQFVNPRFTQVTGYLRDEVVGLQSQVFDWGGLILSNDPQMWAVLECGKVWAGEVFSSKKNGATFWEQVTVSPIRNGSGAITHYLALRQDISEQKRMKEQLLQAQKMEAVGQLAGGVAHDFNNILTAIVGFSSIIQMSLPVSDPAQGSVEQVLKAAKRAASLTQSLLTFSRTKNVNLQCADLNRVVRDSETFLKRVITEDIAVVTSLEEVPPVLADGGQIQQLLMNLVTNASDAMPRAGEVTICTSQRELLAPLPVHNGCAPPGRYAVIAVSDTGDGMDDATMGRIFDPFFTTKEVGKGTGLGLSTVYGIVKQHNGFIQVCSAPGEGTTFEILLPASEGEICRQPLSEVAAPVKGRGETILVAEDDPAVRQLMETVLGSYGYRVILAENGAQAVRRFLEHRSEVQLVVLDMIMPEMNGKEAYERMRQAKQGVPVLYFSGYTMDYIRDRSDLEAGAQLMKKPVEPAELLGKVREMLDRLDR